MTQRKEFTGNPLDRLTGMLQGERCTSLWGIRAAGPSSGSGTLRPLLGRLAALGAAACLSGCPQLLGDDFHTGVTAPEVLPDLGSDSLGAELDGSHLDSAVDPTPDQTPVVQTPEPVQPEVVSTEPRDGARGVPPETEIVITFSVPMDRRSVEAAYTSSDLPAAEVSFAWSAADTVLRIRPNAPLRSSAGSDAASVPTVTYTFSVADSARDAEGQALAAKQSSFSVARSITQALSAIRDRDLTGNWRNDSVYGVQDCERVDTTVCMGDSISSGQPSYRGFMSFDLHAAPADLISISAAELSWDVTTVFGTPFTSLGALQIEHLTFDIIGDEAYSAAPLPERQTVDTALSEGDTASVDVLAALRADWAVRDLTQFRLAYETSTDDDGAADLLISDWSTAQLNLTYWLP